MELVANPEKNIKKASDSFLKQKSEETDKNIHTFKTNGMSFLETLNQTELDHMIIKLNHVYYNTKEPMLTDSEYDIVKEYIMKKYPDDVAVQAIGAPIINSRGKAKLPYEMWSMDKIKPDSGELVKWTGKYKGPYELSWKLDGISGLYTVNNGARKLYTRGDGTVGQDISHLLPVLNLPQDVNMVVRGEFILNKDVFKTKYADKFANPRNMVAGIVNSKSEATSAKDLHFVVYECIVPHVKPSEQFRILNDAGFEVVDHKSFASINNELLSEYLVDKRENSEYEIDGIIVADDNVYDRESGNPDHAFAFKMVLSDQKAEAKVVDVLWEASKHGLLKPRVRIEPVRIGGVTITYMTGNNARYISDNKIGIGAIIELIRSGDVIPKITRVIVPAEQAKMPTEAYKWNDGGADIVIENASDNQTVREKKMVSFFTELDIDGLKAGNVKKIVDAGYDTIPKILKMTRDDFTKVGFKSTADKYQTNIKAKVDDASLVKLMVASGIIGSGIGEKKIAPLVDAFPDIQSLTTDQAKSVKGIEAKTATTIVENIPKFVAFLNECGLSDKLQKTSSPIKQNVNSNGLLYGRKIVMSKTRDKDVIDALEKAGATLTETMTKDVFTLVVKTKDDVSNKTKYASENNIPIMTADEFKAMYI